jgi:FtsP/CotA-like multicopper oxidase with cupredoxin domain
MCYSRLTHPIHLQGHDFWVISQSAEAFNANDVNLINPPPRDVASLPGNGHLAIAFQLDNPGSWLLHCHIAWHALEGFALQFVESEGEVRTSSSDTQLFEDTCTNWKDYVPTEDYLQDDSGI